MFVIEIDCCHRTNTTPGLRECRGGSPASVPHFAPCFLLGKGCLAQPCLCEVTATGAWICVHVITHTAHPTIRRQCCAGFIWPTHIVCAALTGPTAGVAQPKAGVAQPTLGVAQCLVSIARSLGCVCTYGRGGVA